MGKILYRVPDSEVESYLDKAATGLQGVAWKALSTVIERQEGGFVLSQDEDGGDGGWTFAGITCHTYNAVIESRNRVRGDTALKLLTADQVRKQLSNEETTGILLQTVVDIYKTDYLRGLDLYEISYELYGPLISCAVNCGTATANRLFSSIYDRQASDTDNIKEFIRVWKAKYEQIVLHNPEKRMYLAGWLNRASFWYPS